MVSYENDKQLITIFYIG